MNNKIENYNKHYDDGKIKLFMDISTYCNAGCPQCHRTNPDGLDKADWLPLTQWSIEDFKKAFPPETMAQVNEFQFCGTWGDPMMNRDIRKICEYIIGESESNITINTNGSIRNAEWWWNFGILGRDRIIMAWDIEGHTQEMHSHYRQKTELNVILENMEMFSAAGGRSELFTVVFKHNESHLYDIASLAKEHGASSIFFVKSNRFENGFDRFYFTDAHGNEKYLEKSSGDQNDKFYWKSYDLNNDEDMRIIKNESSREK